MKKVWEGMWMMSRYAGKGKEDRSQLNGTKEYANNLSNFYKKLDKIDFIDERLRPKEMIGSTQDDDYILEVSKQAGGIW